MSSELRVDQLNTVAGGTGNISITNGVKLTGAAAVSYTHLTLPTIMPV